ncbi:MAG: hypothetical protein B7Z78_10930 [Rhodospirillales bacterium 20-60-12]|nr:MAG: hypothetical protein B7Z78_10930 [Rhodospirillales bacterium 20-60-12]HQT67690.1 DUF6362 family protein [Acetobacteraceae bacterium]HQU01340.1 DUF6362 family protein [Acetobacteraceae bacterium]
MNIVRVRPAGQRLGSGVGDAGRTWDAASPKIGADGAVMDEAWLIARLEDAGAALLALPASGYGTGMRQLRYDVVHTALETYGWEGARVKPAMPSAARIDRMDESFGWLALIPDEKFLLRRIVGARALVHPITGRHLFPWRRLASAIGADHKAVQRWHRDAIRLIIRTLAAGRSAS